MAIVKFVTAGCPLNGIFPYIMNREKTDEILIFADMMNGLPRKLLDYRTPEEWFDAELDRIFAA